MCARAASEDREVAQGVKKKMDADKENQGAPQKKSARAYKGGEEKHKKAYERPTQEAHKKRTPPRGPLLCRLQPQPSGRHRSRVRLLLGKGRNTTTGTFGVAAQQSLETERGKDAGRPVPRHWQKMSSSSSQSTSTNSSRHSGAARRRRRAGATVTNSRSNGVGPRGTVALVLLLAVVLVMVVIYLVRRLSNVERTVERTLGEVRHQVTPDDLHTAFGQWVEANPAQVTTACAPYINCSVAVAADAIRARVAAAMAAAPAQVGTAPPAQQQQQQHFDHAHANGVQPPPRGGGPLGQRNHQQPSQQGHQPHQQYNRPQSAAPFQHRPPSLQAQGHHTQPRQQQHVQAHGGQQQPSIAPMFVPPPLRSPGHLQGPPPLGANGTPATGAPFHRQIMPERGQPPASPRDGGSGAYRAPDDPVAAATFRSNRPNIRCEGDVCVVVEHTGSPSSIDPGVVPRPRAQATPVASPNAVVSADPLQPYDTPLERTVSPRLGECAAENGGKGMPNDVHRQHQQHRAPTPHQSRHVTPSGSPVPDPRLTLGRDGDNYPFDDRVDGAHDDGHHDDDGNNDYNSDHSDHSDDDDGDDFIDRGDGRDSGGFGVVEIDHADRSYRDGDDDDDDRDDGVKGGTSIVAGSINARAHHGINIASTLSHRNAGYSAAIAVDDPWSLPDESRFFMGRGDESDGDDDDSDDDDDDDKEDESACGLDGDADENADGPDDRYQDDGGACAWYARPVVSAPVFLVLRTSDNGISAPSGGARIVPLDDDDDGDGGDGGDDDDDGNVDHAVVDNADETVAADTIVDPSDSEDVDVGNATPSGADNAANAEADAGTCDADDDGGAVAHRVPESPRAIEFLQNESVAEEPLAPSEAVCVLSHDQDPIAAQEEMHEPMDYPTDGGVACREAERDEPTDTASGDGASSDGDEVAPPEEEDTNSSDTDE